MATDAHHVLHGGGKYHLKLLMDATARKSVMVDLVSHGLEKYYNEVVTVDPSLEGEFTKTDKKDLTLSRSFKDKLLDPSNNLNKLRFSAHRIPLVMIVDIRCDGEKTINFVVNTENGWRQDTLTYDLLF